MHLGLEKSYLATVESKPPGRVRGQARGRSRVGTRKHIPSVYIAKAVLVETRSMYCPPCAGRRNQQWPNHRRGRPANRQLPIVSSRAAPQPTTRVPVSIVSKWPPTPHPQAAPRAMRKPPPTPSSTCQHVPWLVRPEAHGRGDGAVHVADGLEGPAARPGRQVVHVHLQGHHHSVMPIT